MTNEQVVQYWLGGRPASSTNGGQLHTDGRRLYSYQLLIASRHDGAVVIEVPFTSSTTSKHIGLAMKMAEAAGMSVRRSRLEGTAA